MVFVLVSTVLVCLGCCGMVFALVAAVWFLSWLLWHGFCLVCHGMVFVLVAAAWFLSWLLWHGFCLGCHSMVFVCCHGVVFVCCHGVVFVCCHSMVFVWLLQCCVWLPQHCLGCCSVVFGGLVTIFWVRKLFSFYFRNGFRNSVFCFWLSVCCYIDKNIYHYNNFSTFSFTE